MTHHSSRVAPTASRSSEDVEHCLVRIPVDATHLAGELSIVPQSNGVVLFAHGSGSSRYSPRNQLVSKVIQSSGTSTLLFDLLTVEEEAIDQHDGSLRFDIDLLAQRLLTATHWIEQHPLTRHQGIGCFGASTGAAAALVAAAELDGEIDAVVCRSGRTDLAGPALARVTAPTLLLVGGRDNHVRQFNRESMVTLRCKKQIIVIPGATHLFEETGALNEVAAIAAGWFRQYLMQH